VALYQEDGTEITTRAALDALTTPVAVDPPVTFDEAIYEDFAYPTTGSTALEGADPSTGTGKRLKYAAGRQVPTSELDALGLA
jgi:hypothetical protein